MKRDLWGADLVAKNSTELIFIQCKTNRSDIAKGIKELNKTKWPVFVKLWVVIWQPRAREPTIIEAEEFTESPSANSETSGGIDTKQEPTSFECEPISFELESIDFEPDDVYQNP